MWVGEVGKERKGQERRGLGKGGRGRGGRDGEVGVEGVRVGKKGVERWGCKG